MANTIDQRTRNTAFEALDEEALETVSGGSRLGDAIRTSFSRAQAATQQLRNAANPRAALDNVAATADRFRDFVNSHFRR